MAKRIEEVFNDCFERLLLGESIESCLSRYPEHAAELDTMLRTAFDIKRKAFPVQPRPEFKYWARVRMQNVQYYSASEPEEEKVSSSNLRRNLAFSLAALLVFVIASSGTAAASSQAMPDEPLYTVKMAVEQAQLTLTTSDVAKAELYAHLTETRAQEIAVMADQGKTEQVVATTAKLNYQLDQADALLAKYEAALASSGALPSSAPATPSVLLPNINNIPAVPSAPPSTNPTPTPTPILPPPTSSVTPLPPPTPVPFNPAENATTENATVVTSPAPTATAIIAENVTAENATPPAAAGAGNNEAQAGSKRSATFAQNLSDINNAQTNIDASTDKSLSILQNALDKAPDSVKTSLNDAIERTKKARARITSLQAPVQTSTQTSTQTQTSTTSVTNTNPDNSTQQQDTTNRSYNKNGR
ncbi:MAG: DUF5667 domain-containing protein [Dehalococcoidia bacterium]|jgi:hypothetical protein